MNWINRYKKKMGQFDYERGVRDERIKNAPIMKKYNCEICEDTGRVEVDPFYPEDANTPQYDVCECIIKEAETMDEIIDDTIDDDINYK